MITSTSNQHVKMLRELLEKRKARDRSGLFVLEGLRMFREIPADYLEEVYISESFAENLDRDPGLLPLPYHPQILADRVFKSLSDTKNPQGILALARQPVYETASMYGGKAPLLLFLENLQDPGNLGTIIRTAQGAGAAGVIMSRDTCDIFSPKTVRSTMGSLFRVPFVYTEDFCGELEQAADSGVRVFAAALGSGCSYSDRDYRLSSAFVIGNEGNGLTKEAMQSAGETVEIPLQGNLESLNAAVAAAVLLFEAVRQRRDQ